MGAFPLLSPAQLRCSRQPPTSTSLPGGGYDFSCASPIIWKQQSVSNPNSNDKFLARIYGVLLTLSVTNSTVELDLGKLNRRGIECVVDADHHVASAGEVLVQSRVVRGRGTSGGRAYEDGPL